MRTSIRETYVTFCGEWCESFARNERFDYVPWENVGHRMCEALSMSHAVDPKDLAQVAAPYGITPFLLYSSSDGSARVNHVVAEVDERDVRVQGFGRGVVRRVDEGAILSLLWPAIGDETFSLIADGHGAVADDGETLVISITAAVLHRPAPVDGNAAC